MQMRYGKRSIPFLDEMGLINERLMAIHLSVATEEELQLLAKKGAAMVLCSGSEAIVDGNIPPAAEFSHYSSRLAIGSDQTSGGNTSNLFYEMKVGAVLNKCKAKNAAVSLHGGCCGWPLLTVQGQSEWNGRLALWSGEKRQI